MITISISSLVVIFCVCLGFYLNKRAGTKKDKEEAQHIFSILQDEIKSNLDNNLNKDFSSEYLSVLGEEVFKVKMGALATYHHDALGDFIKIYRQFININKALSDYNNLDKPTLSANINAVIPQIVAKNEIIRLRKLCKEQIVIYLNQTF